MASLGPAASRQPPVDSATSETRLISPAAHPAPPPRRHRNDAVECAVCAMRRALCASAPAGRIAIEIISFRIAISYLLSSQPSRLTCACCWAPPPCALPAGRERPLMLILGHGLAWRRRGATYIWTRRRRPRRRTCARLLFAVRAVSVPSTMRVDAPVARHASSPERRASQSLRALGKGELRLYLQEPSVRL